MLEKEEREAAPLFLCLSVFFDTLQVAFLLCFLILNGGASMNKRTLLAMAFFSSVLSLSGMEPGEGRVEILNALLPDVCSKKNAGEIKEHHLRAALMKQYMALNETKDVIREKGAQMMGESWDDPRLLLMGAILQGKMWGEIVANPYYFSCVLEEKDDRFIPSEKYPLSVLHYAAVMGREDLVEAFLEFGVSHEVKDLYGNTPLESVVAIRLQMSTEDARPFAERVGNWQRILEMLCKKVGTSAEEYEKKFRDEIFGRVPASAAAAPERARARRAREIEKQKREEEQRKIKAELRARRKARRLAAAQRLRKEQEAMELFRAGREAEDYARREEKEKRVAEEIVAEMERKAP
jgi:hypothetical protein